jgi:hypothetical protein
VGARKSRHSRSGREARQRYGRRPAALRPPRPVIIVLCDDTRTAVRYFDALKPLYRQHVTIRTERAGSHGAAPPQLLVQAKSMLAAYADSDVFTRLWLLLDTEHDESRRSQALAARSAADGDLHVALSDPCFELWTLLHLEDTGAGFRDCAQVTSTLLNAWQREFAEPTTKKQMPFERIVERHLDAAARAKRQRAANAQSWTEVDRVIDDLRRLKESQS